MNASLKVCHVAWQQLLNLKAMQQNSEVCLNTDTCVLVAYTGMPCQLSLFSILHVEM